MGLTDQEYIDQAETLLKMYGIEHVKIEHHPDRSSGWKNDLYTTVYLGQPRSVRRYGGYRTVYPRVIHFKNAETAFEGVKRMIMRRNPVE